MGSGSTPTATTTAASGSKPSTGEAGRMVGGEWAAAAVVGGGLVVGLMGGLW